MTSITAPRLSTRVTRFERTLLTTAATLDTYVASRLERRAAESARRVAAAQDAAAGARRDAEALGSLGMMPR